MKVNVLTIAYNNIDGIKRTYKSIANQTSKSLIWIVVDGGSSDGTLAWLQGLSPDFPWVWISEKDSGIYNAMNKAVSLIEDFCENSYSIFMNSGDEFYNSSVVEAFEREVISTSNRYSVMYGGACYVTDASTQYIASARSVKKIPNGMPTSHQAMFFRSDLFLKIKFDESFKYGGDYDFLCKAYMYSNCGAGVGVFPLVVCNFYLDGVSVKQRKKALVENFRTRRGVLKLSLINSVFLYFAHYLHMHLKRIFPGLMSYFRRARP